MFIATLYLHFVFCFILAEKKVRIVVKTPSIQGKREEFVRKSAPREDNVTTNNTGGNRLAESSPKHVAEEKGINLLLKFTQIFFLVIFSLYFFLKNVILNLLVLEL